jgi:hypothetical protein
MMYLKRVILISLFLSLPALCQTIDSKTPSTTTQPKSPIIKPIVLQGREGGNGGDSDANAKLALQNQIENESYNLKASMRNYINMIDVDQISDPTVKATINRIGRDNLIDDINRSTYRIEAGSSEAYIPTLGEKSGVKLKPAARTDFSRNSDVRFDLDLLFGELKDLPNEEQKTIALASLAFHETIHHFQTPPQADQSYDKSLLDREAEAYQFSGYVLKSASFGKIPLLIWSASKPNIPPYFLEGIMKWPNGNPMQLNQFDAIGFCAKIGQHLPSAREFALFAITQGAKGIVEVGQLPPGANWALTQAVNKDSTPDNFYYFVEGYKRPVTDIGDDVVWTSSSSGKYSQYGLVFDGQRGFIGVNQDLRSEPMRFACAEGLN